MKIILTLALAMITGKVMMAAATMTVEAMMIAAAIIGRSVKTAKKGRGVTGIS